MRAPVCAAVTAVCCLVGLATARLATASGVRRAVVPRSDAAVLNPGQTRPGNGSRAIKPGSGLRILCVGDSITYGTLSDVDDGDGNGYRLRLRERLSEHRVVFAGTETADSGTMSDGYFAAWPGKTIQFIGEHVGESLQQRPNLILLHAGTNDMNPNPAVSTEGNDPEAAAQRLGTLIDSMAEACPDAAILVAMIIGTCDPAQAPATERFQGLIPDVVRQRRDAGRRVLAANLTAFPTAELQDCIHPSQSGYRLLAGYYWADVVSQVPRGWIRESVGADPVRSAGAVDGASLALVLAVAGAAVAGAAAGF